MLVAGFVLFALGCLGFIPRSSNAVVLATLFVAVGCSTGLVETAQGAHAAELLDDGTRGRGFGLLGLVDGLGDLVSSVVVGGLWTLADPAWGFAYAAALAGLGALVLARPVPARSPSAGTEGPGER